ncbi:MAG: hypothetical protein HC888_00150 [Candidatus Competibacteraceae bacterium]|nr:hypothetical protein [Candidatus Competibacteraceae bacterium]
MGDMMVESIGVVEKKGVNYDQLLLLCMKLDDYLGERKTVKEEDVRAVCVDSADFVIWSLLGFLDDKNYLDALIEMNRAIEKDGDARGVIERTLFQMYWKYKTLWFEKEGIAKGWQQSQLLEEARKIHKFERKEKPDGKKTEKFETVLETQKAADGQPKPYWSDNALIANIQGFYGSKPSLACYNRMELYHAMQAVTETLMNIRQGVGEDEMRLLVDILLMTICGHENADQFARLRQLDDVRLG